VAKLTQPVDTLPRVAVADDFDGFLVDLDGVVWVGREPVPGSAEALRTLIEGGKEIVFVTNNPGRPPATYVERLRDAGIPVEENRVVTAGVVTANLAAERLGAGGGGGDRDPRRRAAGRRRRRLRDRGPGVP